MGTQRRCLDQPLRVRELEVSELSRSLDELRRRFFQLKHALEINMLTRDRREAEFNHAKEESEELQKLKSEMLQLRTELSSRLANAAIERDHWKNAFHQQKEFIERNKVDCDNTVSQMKRECEDILKLAQGTTEKQFKEIIELYNGAKDKVTQLEQEMGTYRSSQREYENRSLELANLLETLKRFDLDVGSVCQLVAEALKNLTEQGNLFEENMKSLRHLAWAKENKHDEPELALLRNQNAVLRDVIKNLKRKFQAQQESRDEVPKRKNEEQNDATSNRVKMNSAMLNNDSPNERTIGEDRVANPGHSINTLIPNEQNYNSKERKERTNDDPSSQRAARANENRKHEFDIESRVVDRCSRVLCLEMHSNGVFYEEYIFKLSAEREIKLKYPILLNNNDTAVVKMELVDNEMEYEKPQFDRILMLFRNIHAAVNVKQTGVPCGTQTTKIKMSNSSAQTTITGINSFSRLNVGVMMLNSEKRAIERSLGNLERTVRTLKLNALDQARTMIAKDSRILGNNELVDCMKLLSE